MFAFIEQFVELCSVSKISSKRDLPRPEYVSFLASIHSSMKHLWHLSDLNRVSEAFGKVKGMPKE
jgi:hypothetical protein